MRDIKEIRNKIRTYFCDLTFDEATHTYFVKGNRIPSVSSLIDKVVEKVDFDQIAIHVAKKEKKTPEQVRLEWKEKNQSSIKKGKKAHAFAEGDMTNPKTPEEKAIASFWNELDSRYVLVYRELQMYHKEFMYAGTCDVLLYDTETDSLILVDYKTNEDLFKNYKGKLLLTPFEMLEEHPYNKYQIQLSLYQILIEQIDLPVTQRWVIWTKPDGTYKRFESFDLKEIVVQWVSQSYTSAIVI